MKRTFVFGLVSDGVLGSVFIAISKHLLCSPNSEDNFMSSSSRNEIRLNSEERLVMKSKSGLK